MKKTVLCILLIFVLGFAGCDSQSVAEVNGVSLDIDSYEEYMTNLEEIYAANATEMAEDMPTLVLEQMVYEELLQQTAGEMDCTPTDKEADTYFEAEMTELYGSYEKGLEQLTDFGVSEDFFRHQYRIRLIENNITDKLAETESCAVTEEEANAIYEENPESYNLRKVSHILIAPYHETSDTNADYTEEEWQTAENRAEEIIDELNDGADFNTLVLKYSDDTETSAAGGKLTTVINSECTVYAKSLIDGALALTAEGEFSKNPIRTVDGYHILRCDFALLASDYQGIIDYIQEETEAQNRSSLLTAFMAEQEEKAEIVYHKEMIQ